MGIELGLGQARLNIISELAKHDYFIFLAAHCPKMFVK